MDISKQFLGTGMTHFINIAVAMLLAGGDDSEVDECSWYFIEYLVDVIFFTMIVCYAMGFLDNIFQRNGCLVSH